MESHELHVDTNHWSIDCLFNSLCGPTSKKHRSLGYWPFVNGIHRWSVNSPHKGSVMQKKLPSDDIIRYLHNIYDHLHPYRLPWSFHQLPHLSIFPQGLSWRDTAPPWRWSPTHPCQTHWMLPAVPPLSQCPSSCDSSGWGTRETLWCRYL